MGLTDTFSGIYRTRFRAVKWPTFLSKCVVDDILVTQAGTGHCVTFRREPNSPMREAMCSMRNDPDAETLQFFAEAWKAAHAKAKALVRLQYSV